MLILKGGIIANLAKIAVLAEFSRDSYDNYFS